MDENKRTDTSSKKRKKSSSKRRKVPRVTSEAPQKENESPVKQAFVDLVRSSTKIAPIKVCPCPIREVSIKIVRILGFSEDFDGLDTFGILSIVEKYAIELVIGYSRLRQAYEKQISAANPQPYSSEGITCLNANLSTQPQLDSRIGAVGCRTAIPEDSLSDFECYIQKFREKLQKKQEEINSEPLRPLPKLPDQRQLFEEPVSKALITAQTYHYSPAVSLSPKQVISTKLTSNTESRLRTRQGCEAEWMMVAELREKVARLEEEQKLQSFKYGLLKERLASKIHEVRVLKASNGRN